MAIAPMSADADGEGDSRAGLRQGWTLVATAWLAVIATSLIAPVLPRMAAHFAQDPGSAGVIQLTVALPALFVALLAAPFGLLSDRTGRRSMLLIALLAYGAFGMAPLFIDSLPLILATRCGVGAAEAAVMTAGTALLGDYFGGARRERWFAIQMGSANLIAVGVLALGGMLGEISWRAPFAVYALPFLLFLLVWAFTWEPARAKPAAVHSSVATAAPFRWRHLLFVCAVTLLGSIAFYVVVIQFSFILTARGYPSPALIGLGAALAAVAVPIGSALFRVLAGAGVAMRLLIAFGLAAIGFLLIAFGSSYAVIVLGAAINGLGSGIYLPTLLTWAVSDLGPQERGRGVGAWQTSFFLGQFLSPISVIQLSALSGGVTATLVGYAGLMAIMATIALAVRLRHPPLGPIPSI